MATLSTRQWRALLAVLAFTSLAACLGLLRRDRTSSSDSLRILHGQQPSYDWQYQAKQSPSHKTNEYDKSTTASTASDFQTVSQFPANVASVPGTQSFTKAIIMGALETEDTSWVAELVGWQPVVYRVDLPDNKVSPTGYRTTTNKGREAMPYLTYIVDFYDALPDVMAFVHPHRSGYPAAWHNDAADYDAVTMLRRLQLPFIERNGYANLRCNWNPGCPDEIRPWREPADLTKRQEHAFPYFYSSFFNRTLEQARQEVAVVGTTCCAQFAVSRKQVRERPKSDYERIRDVILDSAYDDYTSGRVMEYMWHILFGRTAIHCPAMNVCYCDVYGQC